MLGVNHVFIYLGKDTQKVSIFFCLTGVGMKLAISILLYYLKL